MLQTLVTFAGVVSAVFILVVIYILLTAITDAWKH